MRSFFVLLISVISVTAMAGVNAGFTSDKSSGCPPLVVNFTNTSSADVTSYQWNFGNGNKSSLQNPSATFLNPGIYTVELIVSNGATTDSAFETITVFQLPVVNFTADSATCLNVPVSFISNVTPGSAPIVDYAWGFGNGKASNQQNAVYQYPVTGTYDITLVVQDSNGCSANKTVKNMVTVNPVPQAAFTASPTSSCNASQLVTFTNQSTGSGLTYLWNFGDSTSSTTENPTHTYSQEITTAFLLVTDSNGCQSSAKQKISVTNLNPDFIASKTLICTGQKVQFSNTSNFAGTSWFWDFGDGTTSTDYSPIKVYNTAGIYSIKFVIVDGSCGDSITKTDYITVINGFSVGAATFTADSTIACGTPLNVQFTNTTGVSGGGISYLWNFGNGDTSSQENPAELFTNPGNYTISLTITDTSGCVVTVTMPGYIQTAKPVANFQADSTACPGTSIQFYDKSSDAASVLWQFGDGDSSKATNPPHTYYNYGNYTVSITAINATGCSSTLVKPNYIHIDTATANFTVENTFSPCPPLVTEFTNASPATIVRVFWDFGDGYTDTVPNPTHIYFYPGVYTVKMIGYTRQLCTDTVVYNNLVTVQGPTGNFTVTPRTGCVPLQVNFSAVPSGNTKSIWCDLGDGTVISDSLNFNHTYTNVQVYHPQFVLTDHVGCTVSYPFDSIITYALPNLQLSDTTVCANTAVSLVLDSQQYQYNWSPNTYLNCDTCSHVTVIATDTITYNITATNQYGCQATGTMKVNAVALPVLNDSVSVSLCPGDSIQLNAGKVEKVLWTPSTYLDNDSSPTPVCAPLTSTTYSVQAFNAIGCQVTTRVPVTVKSNVSVSITDSLKICQGAPVQLNPTVTYRSDVGISYYWSPPQYFDNPGIANPTVSLGIGDYKLQLVVTSGHCLPDSQTISVMVEPLPDIEASPTVTTTPNAEVPLYAASHQELTYKWQAKDSLSCADCRQTDLYPSTSQTVYVDGTNQQGCTVRDSVEIQVLGCDPKTIYMPNTFTPNGDGMNDKFYIRSQTLTSIKSFRIYDEWGQMVFQTNRLDEGWDGSVAGKEAPMGVYVYVLEAQCQNGSEVVKSGNVTAVR